MVERSIRSFAVALSFLLAGLSGTANAISCQDVLASLILRSPPPTYHEVPAAEVAALLAAHADVQANAKLLTDKKIPHRVLLLEWEGALSPVIEILPGPGSPFSEFLRTQKLPPGRRYILHGTPGTDPYLMSYAQSLRAVIFNPDAIAMFHEPGLRPLIETSVWHEVAHARFDEVRLKKDFVPGYNITRIKVNGDPTIAYDRVLAFEEIFTFYQEVLKRITHLEAMVASGASPELLQRTYDETAMQIADLSVFLSELDSTLVRLTAKFNASPKGVLHEDIDGLRHFHVVVENDDGSHTSVNLGRVPMAQLGSTPLNQLFAERMLATVTTNKEISDKTKSGLSAAVKKLEQIRRAGGLRELGIR